MMRARSVVLLVIASLATWGTWSALHAQKRFQDYETAEGHAEFPIPPDAYDPHEWTRARLIYPSPFTGPHGDVGAGYKRWTIDYPRSDRLLLQGIRRLTRIDSRSVEQSDPLDATDEMCAQLREFLLRGGFFMCDDFHGTVEWENFMASMSRVFPDRPVVDLDT